MWHYSKEEVWGGIDIFNTKGLDKLSHTNEQFQIMLLKDIQ